MTASSHRWWQFSHCYASAYAKLKLRIVALKLALSQKTNITRRVNMDVLNMKPEVVAKYFLLKAAQEGEPITQLKLQKLVYLAYVNALLKNKKLFNENIQAWANGPVVPSLYKLLRKYGYNPIGEDFYKTDINKLLAELKDVQPILDEVFDEYAPKSAFELVTITHNDGAWSKAREGLKPTEISANPIKDEYILAAYSH
ncbi:MAG: Panacea domain-containing protein [Candidatus Saccharimonadales bacterium]